MIVHYLNKEDVVTDVNPEWEAFAAKNSAPTLGREVVGTSIYMAAYCRNRDTSASFDFVRPSPKKCDCHCSVPM